MIHRRTGEVAPPFELPLAGSGERVSLADLMARGGETLLVWMKTTCPTCQLALPFLERIHARIAARGDRRVVVISQDPPADIARFRVEFGCPTVPVLSEPEPYEAADRYGVTNLPTLFLVAAGGKVKGADVGFNRQNLEDLALRFAGMSELFTEQELEELPPLRPG
jgi:thiol-disulfide isomerase/thioredoxin